METVNILEEQLAQDESKRILTFDFDYTYVHFNHPELVHPDLILARRIARAQKWAVAVVTHRTFNSSIRNIKDAAQLLKQSDSENWKKNLQKCLLESYSKTFKILNTPLNVTFQAAHASDKTITKLMNFESLVYKFICKYDKSFADLFRTANTFFENHSTVKDDTDRVFESCMQIAPDLRNIDIIYQMVQDCFHAKGYNKNCTLPGEAQARELVFIARFFDRFKLENNESKQTQFAFLREQGYGRIVHIDDSKKVTDHYHGSVEIRAINYVYPTGADVTEEERRQAQTQLRTELKAAGIDIVDYEHRQVAIQKLEEANKPKFLKVRGHKNRIPKLIEYISDQGNKDWEAVAIEGTEAHYNAPKTGKNFNGDIRSGFKRKPAKRGYLWDAIQSIKTEIASDEIAAVNLAKN